MKKLVTSLFAVLILVGIGNAKPAETKYELAFINAAKDGNASQVRGLLEAGTDPNVTDEHGNTPLIYGAKESAAIVDMLLYAGADVNARGENGITPLINSFSIVTPEAKKIRERLLKAKPDVNAVMNGYICKGNARSFTFLGSSTHGEDGATNCKPIIPTIGQVATALSFAVATDDISAVQMLLKNGADVNISPVLVTAVKSSGPNSTKIVELLLKAGSDPWVGGNSWENYVGRNNVSKVIYADEKQALIEKARNIPSAEQQKLDDKLITAAEKGNLNQVKKLLAKGANPNGRNKYGNTPLFMAVSSSKVNVEVVKALLNAGAKPNEHFGEYYETPLLAAVNNFDASAEVVKSLIDAGADVNARNKYYSTALHYTLLPGNVGEKEKLLVKAGADVNARNLYGRTPLFYAAADKLQFLINAGADVNARDYEGYSALFRNYVLSRNGNIELLQKHGARLTPYEQKRLALEQKRQEVYDTELDAVASEYEAEKKKSGGIGQTLLQGLSNAAQDTANFAIQNAGKF